MEDFIRVEKDLKSFSTSELLNILTIQKGLYNNTFDEETYGEYLTNETEENRLIRITGLREVINDKFNILFFDNNVDISTIKFNIDSNVINESDYQNIFVTSDINADLKSLFINLICSELLILEGCPLSKDEIIAKCNTYVDIWEEFLVKYHCFPGKNFNKSALVVLGNLINGRRAKNFKPYVTNTYELNKYIDVYNPWGLNELGIHIILYNLKVLGKKLFRSNVFITYGSNEVSTLIKSDYKNIYLHQYIESINNIDEMTKNTFTFKNRHDILMPFYLINNYAFIVITTNTDREKERSRERARPIPRSRAEAGERAREKEREKERARAGGKYIKYILSSGGFSALNSPFTGISIYNLSIINKNISDIILDTYEYNKLLPFNHFSVNDMRDEKSYFNTLKDSNIMKHDFKTVLDLIVWTKNQYYTMTLEHAIDYNAKSSVSPYCKELDNFYEDKYITYIMGSTTYSEFGSKIILKDNFVEGCIKDGTNTDDKDCIYAGCVDETTKRPRIIFVDNSLSVQNSRDSVEKSTYVYGKKIYVGQCSRHINIHHIEQLNKFGEILVICPDESSKKGHDIILIYRNNFDTGTATIYELDLENGEVIAKRKICNKLYCDMLK